MRFLSLFSKSPITKLGETTPAKRNINWIEISVFILSLILSIGAIIFAIKTDTIVAYGDAESHLNIAKRVVSSITPGMAQLGGIWLPLPHMLMIPFAYFDPLWQSGLAGTIVSSISYVISCLFMYRMMFCITNNKPASFVTFLIFATNPNILYMQTTPMTEMPLIMFFILSSYYFFKFIRNHENILALLLAGFFGFCATLSRYDGWLFVAVEVFCIFLYYLGRKWNFKVVEGKIILYSAIAFLGVGLWLLWDFLILGNPFYFTDSPFSAKSQQMNWMAKGELPSYKNIVSSLAYYSFTSLETVGVYIFILAVVGLVLFLLHRPNKNKVIVTLILMVPFFFYVLTLYVGQSVIFIPGLTPDSFEYKLFNVRYGVMMVPALAVFFGYLFAYRNNYVRFMLILFFAFQMSLFITQKASVITYADGTVGLSSAKRPYANDWIEQHYDSGLVLMDDYARTISITKTKIPMQSMIYIGNKPYWEESLAHPEKYATWVIVQKDDAVWSRLFSTKASEANLYKYFNKVYTSPTILIFKRIT